MCVCVCVHLGQELCNVVWLQAVHPVVDQLPQGDLWWPWQPVCVCVCVCVVDGLIQFRQFHNYGT